MINKDTPFKDILRAIRWKSCDKDNMEFTAIISYAIMDRISEFLGENNDDSVSNRKSPKQTNTGTSKEDTSRTSTYGGL